MKVPNMKFHENPPSGSRADTCWQTDGHYEAASVTVKRKVCCRVVKNIFLMFLNARGVHDEFYNFSLQERLLSCIRLKEDETHHGDKKGKSVPLQARGAQRVPGS